MNITCFYVMFVFGWMCCFYPSYISTISFFSNYLLFIAKLKFLWWVESFSFCWINLKIARKKQPLNHPLNPLLNQTLNQHLSWPEKRLLNWLLNWPQNWLLKQLLNSPLKWLLHLTICCSYNKEIFQKRVKYIQNMVYNCGITVNELWYWI